MSANIDKLIKEFKQLKNSIASMVFFVYTNKDGKVAKRWVNINTSYLKAIYKDIPYLEELYAEEKEKGLSLRLVAIAELLQSAVLSYRLKLIKELAWSKHMISQSSNLNIQNKWIARNKKILEEIKRVDNKYNIPLDVKKHMKINLKVMGKIQFVFYKHLDWN